MPVLVPPVSSEDGLGYLELPRETIQIAFVEKPVFSLTVEPPSTGFVIDRAKKPELQLPCKVERCAECLGADVPLKFDVEEIPEGVRVTSQQVEAGSAVLMLAADPKAVKPGQYRIALRATADVNGRQLLETSSAIPLRVK